jgi:hypothetical protein
MERLCDILYYNLNFHSIIHIHLILKPLLTLRYHSAGQIVILNQTNTHPRWAFRPLIREESKILVRRSLEIDK